jgi:glyoxylase-like metal-dependent hydrolase (beta-lactamase superfamily II)
VHPPSQAEPHAIEYPTTEVPVPGTSVEIAPGVWWLRMLLPFALNHINLWLLEDGDGWTIVDTGLGDEATRAHWEQVFTARLGGRPVRRVLVTHYHPDHAGNAGWLCRKFGVGLWMTQGEYLSAHAVRDLKAGYGVDMTLALYAANGVGGERYAAMTTRGNVYAAQVTELPASFHQLFDGDRLSIGGRDWRVIVGYGHAPEHASLYCAESNTLISGDMLLPKISTNVSVWSVDPLGNPLKRFLDAIERYRDLPADVLVLPSHGLPFRGAHARVAELSAHHDARFAELEAACSGGARSAADLLEVIFPRKLDVHQMFFAMGEAIAHLHWLHEAGRMEREVGTDGVARFRSTERARAVA